MTLVVLGIVLVVLARELLPPAVSLLGGLTILVLARTIEPEVAFAGFSSEATIAVGALFVVARAIRDHVGIDAAMARFLGSSSSDRVVLVKLLLPTAAMSSVLANTPMVAALAPMVRTWAERHGRAASHFLIPLSFAAILGGLVTTIGTSTNLVVSGLIESAGQEPFDFFEVLPLGLPVAIVGVALTIPLAPRLLPDRRSPHEQVASADRDYSFRLRVLPDGPLVGRSIEDAGLRNLEDAFVVRIDRDGREIAPVTPITGLMADDVLTLVGSVDHVRDLADRPGLAIAESQAGLLEGAGHTLWEAVIRTGSSLVGRTLKEASFRGRYGGAVLAIHRAGHRLEGKLGAHPLHAGDALLVMADQDYEDRVRWSGDFSIIVPLTDGEAPRTHGRLVTAASVLGLVAVAATGLLPLLHSILAAVVVLLLTRTITVEQARRAIDLDILLIIAGAIGLGAAVAETGLATELATIVTALAGDSGLVVALLLIVLATMALTELVTNVAAAALMVPVAVDVAATIGADSRGLAVAVAIAASSSFLTPVGYQTNTIVYGLGGYRFGDWWRLGAPITLAVIVVTLVVVPAVWG
ncbi:MAG: SLC13 family permease [Nitriliruptorales bacterium]|nr:SLC13 family permease [Nitriliruptorales bacterium]